MDTYISLIVTFLVTILIFLQYKFRYWELRRFPQPKATHFYGTLSLLQSLHYHELFHELYKEGKGKFKIVGSYIFTKPIALVLDLDLIKAILIKDFSNFTDRTEDYETADVDPLADNIGRVSGDKWRNLRHKLTPTFTAGKMKQMFPIMRDLSEHYAKIIGLEISQSKNNVLELYNMNGRFTTDVIANIIFGLDNNSMDDENNPLRKIGRQFINQGGFNIHVRLFKQIYVRFVKLIGRVQTTSPRTISNFIIKLITDTVEYREKNNIKRNDLMELLINLKNTKDETGKPQMTINEVAAQAFVFFVAGFETSASAMTFALYELAKHPDIQEKLRAHLFEVLAKHKNELTYEALSEMTYLNCVSDESLRLHPALISFTRLAKNDYPVPGTKLVIPAGTKLYIPIKEIHMDPDVYENPTEFRPERFEPEEIAKRHPTSFLSFGDGPRNCIGLRFGRLQSRTGLVALLTSFKFSLCEETPREITYSKHNSLLVPTDGLKLRIEKL